MARVGKRRPEKTESWKSKTGSRFLRRCRSLPSSRPFLAREKKLSVCGSVVLCRRFFFFVVFWLLLEKMEKKAKKLFGPPL